MRKHLLVLFLCGMLGNTFAQRLTFSITNDSIDNEFYITKINHEVLETVTLETFNFNVDINFDDGYYFLKKEEEQVLLYLKRNDAFSIAFDAEEFNTSLTFSGNQGGGRNTYLRSKVAKQIDENGNLRPFYERAFYEGNENQYLDRLDQYYKGFYGTLFGSGFDEDFVNEESKNLQYGYYLDLLKFQKAKEYYQFTDSVQVSDRFLAPLRNLHFDNQLFSEKYPSYNELAVLKWVNDIQNSNDYPVMEGIVASIQTEAIQKGVLIRLYELMTKDEPSRMQAYFDFIKRYSKDNALIEKAKAKSADVREKEAEKYLAKFNFFTTNKEPVKLAEYKGNYIFLYVWATFCKDCAASFKKIEKLSESFDDEPIVFLGVSVDKKENFELWKNLVKEQSIQGSAQQLFLNGNRSKIVNAYGISTIPSVVILSPKGEKLDVEINEINSKKTKRALQNVIKEEE